MKIEIDDTYLSAFTSADDSGPYYQSEFVYVGHPYDGEYPEFDLTPAQAREFAAALLSKADEAEVRTPPLGWFADLTDEDERNPEYPWQPFFQDNVGCFPLPLWFATESECNDFIRGEIVGRGFLPGEGK